MARVKGEEEAVRPIPTRPVAGSKGKKVRELEEVEAHLLVCLDGSGIVGARRSTASRATAEGDLVSEGAPGMHWRRGRVSQLHGVVAKLTGASGWSGVKLWRRI